MMGQNPRKFHLLRFAAFFAVLFVCGSSYAAWSTSAAPDYFTATCPLQSIERDGKGYRLIAYHRSGAVWLKYRNATQYVDVEVFSESDIESDLSIADTFITSVSIAVRHSIDSYPAATTICVAAGTGRVSSNVSFVYEELSLSSGGTLTAGTRRYVALDQGVETGANSNAMQWFDPASCHAQPAPANNRYYADGTHHDTFIRHSGFVRAAYTEDSLMFACSVGGFVSHDSIQSPTNSQPYWYEEHQALYLIEEIPGSPYEYEAISSGGDDFEFETCEILNSDAPSLGANANFQFTADHTIEDSWVIAYTNLDYINPTFDGVEYARSYDFTKAEIPSHRTPFVAFWDGNPYVIYDHWETYFGYIFYPSSCAGEDYIVVAPLDPSPSGLGTGFLGLACAQTPGYAAGSVSFGTVYSNNIKYVGVSADGQDLHVVSSSPGDTQGCAWYKVEGPKSTDFTVSDSEDGPVEYTSYYFGDRIAVRTSGKAAFLVEEGEEDRGRFDYDYRIVEKP